MGPQLAGRSRRTRRVQVADLVVRRFFAWGNGLVGGNPVCIGVATMGNGQWEGRLQSCAFSLWVCVLDDSGLWLLFVDVVTRYCCRCCCYRCDCCRWMEAPMPNWRGGLDGMEWSAGKVEGEGEWCITWVSQTCGVCCMSACLAFSLSVVSRMGYKTARENNNNNNTGGRNKVCHHNLTWLGCRLCPL